MKKTADIHPVGNYKLRKVKQGVRMGINLNNNNSFGKLTTSNLNQAKATKNAGNIADAKAANAANSANTLNSATLKSNQGLKLDSNNFGKADVVPANDNPPVANAKGKKSGGSDKGGKKTWSDHYNDACEEWKNATGSTVSGQSNTEFVTTSGGSGSTQGTCVGLIAAIIATVRTIKG